MTGELRKAFISDFTFAIGEHSYEGVFTAEYLDQQDGTFRIQLDPLGYTADGDPISVIITDDDIRGVRELLGLPDPETRRYVAHALAMEALNDIAEVDNPTPSTLETWRALAEGMKTFAKNALATLAHWEDSYATAADGA